MYLGVPAGIVKKKKTIFSYIKHRIWQRIQSWKGRAPLKELKRVRSI